MAEVPVISVITVNLNNCEGLKRTIRSVLEQDYGNYEFLVIDGGSTDGSKEYIESQNNKIDYWRCEQDTGIYNAMNKGIRASKGEYLIFLNSGDWLNNKDVLKNAAQELDGCDVLYGNMLQIFPDGREVLDRGINGREISLRTFIEGTINHSASFLKRKLFLKYGFYDEKLKIVSDWKLFLIALGLNNSDVSYIDLPISNFDMNGISNRDLSLRNRERSMVLKEIVPRPIYTDYLTLKEQENSLNATRLQKFLKTDQNTIARKFNSAIFRLFS